MNKQVKAVASRHYVDMALYTRGLNTTAWDAIKDITIKLVMVYQSLTEIKVTLVTSGMHTGPQRWVLCYSGCSPQR